MVELDNKKFGLTTVSLVDYPKNVAATLFINGCNMRCPFCQNFSILSSCEPADFISFKQILEYLEKRKKVLSGVCITGGEPTLFPNLKELINSIKLIGYKIKLDTNGTNPELLKELNIDYIAMDIKTSLEKYHMCGNVDIKSISKSIEVIKNLNIDYEFRTTAVKGLTDYEDFEKISNMINGAAHYTINNFRNSKVLDKSYENIQPYSKEELEVFKKIFETKKINCQINSI